MHTLRFTSRIDADRLLQVTVPEQLMGQEVEVVIVLQPLSEVVHEPVSRWAKLAERIECDNRFEGGWSIPLKEELVQFRHHFFSHDD